MYCHHYFYVAVPPFEGLTLAHAADLHGAVPLAILAGQVVVVSAENEAVVAEELDHGAVGKHPTGGRVAGVASVLRLGERQTS